MKERRGKEGRSFYDYSCLFVLSYGMTRDEKGLFHPTFYSGMVAKAVADLLRRGKIQRIIIESANVLRGVALNDGDLMAGLMKRFGVPGDAITVRRNHKNTYEKIDDMAAIRGRYPGDVLTLCTEVHEHRVRALLKKRKVKSHVTTMEDVLRAKWKERNLWNREVREGERKGDSISKFFEDVAKSPDYIKSEKLEDIMVLVSRFDRDDAFAKRASNLTFPLKGADVLDVKDRQHIRGFATLDKNRKKLDRLIIVPPLGQPPMFTGTAVVEDPKH